MRRKLLLFILLVFSVFCLFAVACSGKGSTDNGLVNEFSISKKTLSMSVYERYRLTVNAEGVTWSTSDESVLLVDQTGMVTAIKEGESTVYAKLGGKQVSCDILVTPSLLVPQIVTDLDRENRIIVGDVYNLDFNYVVFNGNNYLSQFGFISSNESVLSVSNSGVLTAKSEGEAVITATTIFRGTEVKESFNYLVISADELCIPNHNVELYSFDYGKYTKTAEIGAKVIQNGRRVDSATFDYAIANESIVSVSDGIIIANSTGKTEIVVTANCNGKTYNDTIFVSVVKPIFISNEILSLEVTDTPYSFETANIFNKVEGYNTSEIVSIFDKTSDREIQLNNDCLDLYSILPQSQEWIIYNEYYGVEIQVDVTHDARIISPWDYTSVTYSTDVVSGNNAWSYSVAFSSWVGQIKFVGDTFDGNGIVLIKIYVNKSLSNLALSTTNKYTDGRIAYLTGGTWNRIEIPVATYNNYVTEGTVLYITNGDNVSSAKVYIAEPEFYVPEFSTTNATQSTSTDVVYGTEESSTAMYATGWQLKFVLTQKITDTPVEKVAFYVNTNMTNPVYGLYLRIGSRNIELRANTWTKVELDINIYNNLVDNQTELKIDDGNGVNHKTFYFSKLYFN